VLLVLTIGLYLIPALLTMTIGLALFSHRTLVIVGSIIFAVGYLLDGMAPTPSFLFFSHGVLVGM
jgi:hypothetical protein